MRPRSIFEELFTDLKLTRRIDSTLTRSKDYTRMISNLFVNRSKQPLRATCLFQESKIVLLIETRVRKMKQAERRRNVARERGGQR